MKETRVKINKTKNQFFEKINKIDPEESDGEGGGRGDQDGEHM